MDTTTQSQAVIDYIDAKAPELIELMQKMIQTRSINSTLVPESPGEGEMAKLVTSRYESLGVPVETVEAVPGRPNVIATLRGSESSPRLLVNCHMDTHPADLGEWIDPFTGEVVRSWTFDPFAGEIHDGKIYGRGAADHKSPIASTLMAVEALIANGIRLKGDLTCIHDVDEEAGGKHGMQYLADNRDMDFDMALYACTSEFTPRAREFFPSMGTHNIIRSFSGLQAYRIRMVGQNLHAITPKRAYGAAEATLLLIDRLRPLIERVNQYVDPIEGRGQPAMRITAIDCEPRGAVHHQARWAELTIIRRIPPTVDQDEARQEIEQVVSAHNAEYPNNAAALSLLREIPARSVPEDHPLVRGLAKAVEAGVGGTPTVVGVPSPVGISQLLAKRSIPTVLFGYGLLNLHHAIDEHIACDALVKTAKVYALAFMEWLDVADQTA